MNNKIELLAPCGNSESFISAINAGADAVYVGLKDFSARSKAKNFSYKQLNEMCLYAKEKNVKVFVALNTLIKTHEIKQAVKTVEQINAAKADAVIVQDLGIALIIKKYFPQLKLHASTQLAICNSYGVKQAEKAGFVRAVLARELSFEEIKHIKQNAKIELEIFCHGALCFCVSGLCMFSSFIGGHSGNRGHCAQPCRRLWSVENKKGYYLSPKDFQLIDYIKQIKDLGITSLKIEGRLKSADYVAKTVKAYRLLIDSDENDFEQNLRQAKEILSFDYARQKTSFNFFNVGSDIFEPQKSKHTGLYLGTVEKKTSTTFFLKTENKIELGDTLRLVDKSKDKNSVLCITNMAKTDNLYEITYENLYIENGFEVYKISDKQNGVCQDIFENLPDLPQPETVKIHIPEFKYAVSLPELFIRINNVKWLSLLQNVKAETVIKLSKNTLQNIRNIASAKKYFFELPAYMDEDDINLFSRYIDFFVNNGQKNFIINNISHFKFFDGKTVTLYSGQFLYALNPYSAQVLAKYGVKGFTVSWEDDFLNIQDLSKMLKDKLIVYLSGFPEVSLSKMKFVKDIENKNIKSDKDEFKIVSGTDNNIIIPKYPINIFSFKNNLMKLKINSFGIDLSYVEPNKNYLAQVLKAFNGQAYINSANKFNFERQLK